MEQTSAERAAGRPAGQVGVGPQQGRRGVPRTRGQMPRRHLERDGDWSEFTKGLVTGCFVTLSLAFVALGAWFRSAEAAPYRFMIGAAAPASAGSSAGTGTEAGSADNMGRRPVKAGGQAPMALAPLRWLGLGMEPTGDAAGSASTRTESDLTAEREAANDQDSTAQQTMRGAANSAADATGPEHLPAAGSTGSQFGTRTAEGVGPGAQARNQGPSQSDRDELEAAGVGELVRVHERNAKVVGSAGKLLKALGGGSR